MRTMVIGGALHRVVHPIDGVGHRTAQRGANDAAAKQVDARPTKQLEGRAGETRNGETVVPRQAVALLQMRRADAERARRRIERQASGGVDGIGNGGDHHVCAALAQCPDHVFVVSRPRPQVRGRAVARQREPQDLGIAQRDDGQRRFEIECVLELRRPCRSRLGGEGRQAKNEVRDGLPRVMPVDERWRRPAPQAVAQLVLRNRQVVEPPARRKLVDDKCLQEVRHDHRLLRQARRAVDAR